MRYLDRRVTVHLWVLHVVIFGYTFSIVNSMLDDPGKTLLAAVIAAVPVGAVVLMQRRRARRRYVPVADALANNATFLATASPLRAQIETQAEALARHTDVLIEGTPMTVRRGPVDDEADA